jgi:hypothetical protein
VYLISVGSIVTLRKFAATLPHYLSLGVTAQGMGGLRAQRRVTNMRGQCCRDAVSNTLGL